MKNRFVAVCIVVAACLGLSQAPAIAADAPTHKVAFQINDNDPKRMNLVLNNMANVQKYYESKGETVEIELVAYGPGLHMLRADTSPVKDRIASMSLASDEVTFSACANTHRNMSKKAGGDIQLLDESQMVPSGVIQIISLQEQGYSYIKP